MADGAPSLRLPPPPLLPSPCPLEPVLRSKSVAVPPTSARALGGSLFRGHKAPLILGWAPSHVTRWAGHTLRQPAQPDSAAGVSPPLPLFPPASHHLQGGLRCHSVGQPPRWSGGGTRSSASPGSPARPGGTAPVPGRVAAGARSPRGAQIFGLRVEEKSFVRPQLSLCKYLASRAEWRGPPPAGVSWRSQFPFCKGLP